VKKFCPGELAEQPQVMHMGTVDLVNDLWRAVDTSVQALRKISVPANDVGSCCLRCGAKWGEGQRERHHPGCVPEETEP
jgi:hypothetical protein